MGEAELAVIEVIEGDCRDVLASMPESSIPACWTDPPYELGFMGREWDKTGIAFQAETWRLLLRVLKPGAHALICGGTRTFHRMACAIEDAGFEIRDCLMWVYGSGFPKSHDISKAIDKAAGAERDRYERPAFGGTFSDDGGTTYGTALSDTPATPEAAQWEGWGTALKPAWEPIILARKPLAERTVAANVLQYGTGAINIDACRVPASSGEKTSDTKPEYAPNYSNSVFGKGMGGGDWTLASAGRWPANVCHDGSDEVEAAFAAFGDRSSARANGNPNERTKGNTGMFSAGAGVADYRDTGTASRFFMRCEYTDKEWTQFINASDAAATLSLQSEHVVSALSDAVAQSMPQSALLKQSFQAPSTSATQTELRLISGLSIAMTQSIASAFWQGLPLTKLSLSLNHAECVAHQTQTDIMQITISHWKSNGSAAPVTFSITLPNLERGEKDSVLRFNYCAKASKADRADSKHPTVKPVELIKYFLKMIVPPDGMVIDPFGGSGSLGEAALLLGCDAILIEKEPQHVADIRHRVDRWSGADCPLFAEAVGN